MARVMLWSCATLALLCAGIASAETLQVDFSGTVYHIGVWSDSQILADDVSTTVAIGTPLSGHFVFDDELDLGYPYSAIYPSPPWTFSLSVGGYTGAPGQTSSGSGWDGAFEIRVTQGNGMDLPSEVAVISILEPLSGEGSDTMRFLSFNLYLTTFDPLPDRISEISWDPAIYTYGKWMNLAFSRERSDGYFESVVVAATIDSLVATPVAEPGSATLAALGLCALGFRWARLARSGC